MNDGKYSIILTFIGLEPSWLVTPSLLVLRALVILEGRVKWEKWEAVFHGGRRFIKSALTWSYPVNHGCSSCQRNVFSKLQHPRPPYFPTPSKWRCKLCKWRKRKKQFGTEVQHSACTTQIFLCKYKRYVHLSSYPPRKKKWRMMARLAR